MKKFTLTITLVIFMLTLANAQFTKVGGGLALSSGFQIHQQEWEANKSGVIALSFKGIYEISVPLHISPSFTIFYPNITKDEFYKTIVSSMMFDINGHYVFNSLDKFEFYGLAGIDILLAKKKETYLETQVGGPDPIKDTENTLGLNLGAGTYMKITEQFDISGEIKYVFGKNNQLMINAGILLNIDWMKKHENSGL